MYNRPVYSRNNSWSRSANAEAAESENRYPLTRAPKNEMPKEFYYAKKIIANVKAGRQFNADLSGLWHHEDGLKGMRLAGYALNYPMTIVQENGHYISVFYN